MKIAVTGAGGFIGYHLTRRLKALGHTVVGFDLKAPEFGPIEADEFLMADLRIEDNPAWEALQGCEWLFALAADMGGMGFISRYHREILVNNLRINLNTAEMAAKHGVRRVFFSSSACVYPEYRQTTADASLLKESDAFPADPQDAYGWEKLTAEELYTRYHEDGLFEARIARFHNIFGPLGSWQGGREKAPAALCRKVAEEARYGQPVIEVWGDGQQTRSFLYIDDCIDGVLALMASDYSHPLNIGSARMVTINQLTDMIAHAAGWVVLKRHIDGPQGVRGRGSDNALCEQELGWTPRVSLEDGLARTYGWIAAQVEAAQEVA